MLRTESVEGYDTCILFRIGFLVSLSGFSGNSAKEIKRARTAWHASQANFEKHAVGALFKKFGLYLNTPCILSLMPAVWLEPDI